MYLRSWVGCGIALVLASASLVCSQATRGQTQEADLTPNDNEVRIKVNCPPEQANGPDVRVILRPQLREVDAGVDVYWTREMVGGGSHSTDFSIQPEDETRWPWTDGAFPWTGTERIDGTAKSTQVRETDFKYSIKFSCNGEEVTLDPRMRVR